MFHTLSNVQRGGAIPLQAPIDNRDGDLQVGLRSITYTVGWYNVLEGEYVQWVRDISGMSIAKITPPPGLYNWEQLCNVIGPPSSEALSISINRSHGKIKLDIQSGWIVRFTDGLLRLIGLDDGLGGQWLEGGTTYFGDRPVDLMPTKELYVHLEQIKSNTSIRNGAPSTLLTTIGLGSHCYGDVATIRFERPEFKRLQDGTLPELELSVRDGNGQIILNHDLPISVTLEVIKHEYLRL